ncbi:MAG: hypothetical protein ACYTG4_08685, partial [Planctomycetota bacterium]
TAAGVEPTDVATAIHGDGLSAAEREAAALVAELAACEQPYHELPEDLRRRLDAALTGETDLREALFRLLWEDGNAKPRLDVLMALRMLPDQGQGRRLMAAFQGMAPDAELRKTVRNARQDPDRLASMILTAGGREITTIYGVVQPSAENVKGPVFQAFFAVAERGADEKARAMSYHAIAKRPTDQVKALLLRRLQDPVRSDRERNHAARAFSQVAKQVADAELVDLVDRSPDAVRLSLVLAMSDRPISDDVDGKLLDLLSDPDSSRNLRRRVAAVLSDRIRGDRTEAGENLARTVADRLRQMPLPLAAECFETLGGVAVRAGPIRETLVAMHSSSPPGGEIQVAVASSQVLTVAMQRAAGGSL